MKVKICGLTTLEAAQAAEEEGADYLGFIFTESKRKVEPETAAEIIRGLSGRAQTVGVFTNERYEEILRIQQMTGINLVQLHGRNQNCRDGEFPVPVIQAVPIYKEEDYKTLDQADSEYVLADLPKKEGHTPMAVLDWKMLQKACKSPERLFLAGGLTPENAAEAAAVLSPFALDVASGVETGGKKDLQKIRQFIRNAKCTANVKGGKNDESSSQNL